MVTIHNLLSLSGRTAVITGSAGFLGRVFADTLAQQGAHLALLDINENTLGEVADDLGHRYPDVVITTHTGDLESSEERQRLAAKVQASHRSIDVLLNSAAFGGTSALDGWTGPLEEQSLISWRRALEVNLTAIFELCQAFAAPLAASKHGSIINIGSIYGPLGPNWSLYEGTAMANPAAYASSKEGLIGLTRWLATALAPRVRVNAISPGGVYEGQPPAFVERYEKLTPLGRMASPDDLRGAVAYLASDLASYVTGQNFFVDGGWSAW